MAEPNQRYSKWGFVRETRDMASGTDKETGLNRTGLEDYIKVIFPEIPVDHWVHDKPIPDSGRRIRPDYRCDDLKLLIEFDGLQHYQQLYPLQYKVNLEFLESQNDDFMTGASLLKAAYEGKS